MGYILGRAAITATKMTVLTLLILFILFQWMCIGVKVHDRVLEQRAVE